MSWWKSLSVRGRALIVGLILTSALITVGSTVKVPYVALGPGTTINTLGTFDGTDIFTFSGTGVPAATEEQFGDGSHLNMTTVSITDGITLFSAMGLWASGDYSLVPREEQFPPDKTVEEVRAENAKSFSDSQSTSEVAALRYLDYPEVTYVGSIPEGSPSVDALDPQDQILAVDGQAVTTADSLRAILADTKPGQVVTVSVRRVVDGSTAVNSTEDVSTEDVDEKVTLGANESGPQGFLGISPVDRPVVSFTISNALAASGIGGPSAGLMFTLGIIDRLTPGDMAGGHFVAGTGTITDDGVVGPIGGIVLKEISVSDAGAEYFLVPADNCAEALTRVPAGLTLVKVTDLADAVSSLDKITKGEPTIGC